MNNIAMNEIALIAGLGLIVAALTFAGCISFRKIAAKHLEEEPDAYRRMVGKAGEMTATRLIQSVLEPDDILFTNVLIHLQAESAELDNLIINKSGIHIIEVKNWYGDIIGELEEPVWHVQQTDGRGGIRFQQIKNPILQVERQKRILATVLEQFWQEKKSKDSATEADRIAWERVIQGNVYFVQRNCPSADPRILQDEKEMDAVLHAYKNGSEGLLSDDVQRKLLVLFEERMV